MTLIGLTGPIGHGKTTLAGYFASLESTAQQAETSEVIAEVADRLNKFFLWEAPSTSDYNSVNRWLIHLPAILQAVTHCSVTPEQIMIYERDVRDNPSDYQKLWEYIDLARHNPRLLTEHISPKSKEAYRSLLQWLGGYLVKNIDEGIWYNELIRRAHSAERNGCELFIIGGLRFPTDAVILRRAGGTVVRITRPEGKDQDSNDTTERERDSIKPDTTIRNNGSLKDLKHCAGTVYRDIRQHNVKSSYTAGVIASLL